jgi:membrane protease YdiL (CAAX protease family)
MEQHPTIKPPSGPWLALAAFVAAFAGAYSSIQLLQSWATSLLAPSTAKEIVLVQAVFSICLVWVVLGLTILILKTRQQSFGDIGLKKRASIWGWILAIGVAVAYSGFVLLGPVGQNSPFLTDWSLYRISLAIGLGVSAGICEETVFRGFIMKQVADAGLGPIFQVIISAVFFGAAHLGWGQIIRGGGIAAALPAIMITMILGCALAIVYLVGRRSLAPVITAHMLIDMAIEPWLLLFAVSGQHA